VVSAVPRRTRKRRVANPRRPAARRIAIEGEKQIYLHPSGWIAAQWWDEEQVDNILRAVDTLKRKYNIDESKIYLTGISDGGTGVYYMALKEPNPWSAYLPLNGSVAVLRNPDNGADGEMHGNNFINAPLYVVNGENDPLYPVAQVEPHIAWLKKMGVT
jgi:predicted peptidase